MDPNVSPPAAFEQRYSLGPTIGQGSFGRVHRALHRATARPVAVKIVSGRGPSSRAHGRLRREARALSHVDHGAVVQLFDYFEAPERLHLVTELLPGRTLARIVADEAPLAPARAIDLTLQLLDALAAVHRAGIVHRDVKPANVMVCVDDAGRERVKLIDFGISAALDDAEQRAEIVGTPRYMAPEQLRPGAGARVDLFATGALLYELLAGEPAFPGRTLQGLLSNQVQSAVPDFAPRLAVPPSVGAVVRRALEAEPGARWSDAGSMARALVGCWRGVSRAPRPSRGPAPTCETSFATTPVCWQRRCFRTLAANNIAASIWLVACSTLPAIG